MAHFIRNLVIGLIDKYQYHTRSGAAEHACGIWEDVPELCGLPITEPEEGCGTLQTPTPTPSAVRCGPCSEPVKQVIIRRGVLRGLAYWFKLCKLRRGASTAVKLPLIALSCLTLAFGADVLGDGASDCAGDSFNFCNEGDSDFCGSRDDWLPPSP